MPDAPALSLDLSPQARADAEAYLALLRDWNGRMNLVGPSALETFWTRHFLDSAQLVDLAPDALTWADLGTGAGLPGVVIALLLKEKAGARVHLVESMAKRCRFLETVVAELNLPAQVHLARAETLELKVDVVAARACAPLTKLLGFAKPYLDRGARGLFLKGESAEAEIAEARVAWRFQADLLPSQSDPSGRIISITRLVHG